MFEILGMFSCIMVIIFILSTIFTILCGIRLNELKGNNEFNMLYLGKTNPTYSKSVNDFIIMFWVSVGLLIFSFLCLSLLLYKYMKNNGTKLPSERLPSGSISRPSNDYNEGDYSGSDGDHV